MKTKRWIGSMIVLAFTWDSASAASRFVSTIGADDANPCTNPATPCRTIGHALESIASGDEVYIASGTYLEGNSLVDVGSVRIAGGWDDGVSVAGPTVIQPGSGRGFEITASGATTGTIELHDLTIQKAKLRGGDPGVYAYDQATRGAGLLVSAAGDSSLDVLIDGVSFIGNRAPHGGGVTLRTEDSATISATIVDSTFLKNRTGGGGSGVDIVTEGGIPPSVVVRNSTFDRNKSKGSGSGVGFRVQDATASATLRIERSKFHRNRSGSGSAVGADARGSSVLIELENNAFLRNRAALTGTVAVHAGPGDDGDFGSIDIDSVNNTLARNSASGGAGGFVVGAGNYGFFPGAAHLVSENDIAFGNGTADVHASSYFGADVTVTRRNGIHGAARNSDATIIDEGVISERPGVDRTGHLVAGSPAIDAVACDAAPAVDIDGDARPSGLACDMGADEFLP